MAQPSDADLLAGIAAGDERALRGLLERHSAWLLLRLRRRTYDEELAASALQDTFVAVWRNPRGFRGDGDVGVRESGGRAPGSSVTPRPSSARVWRRRRSAPPG